jgi:threonine synthase
VKPQTIAKSIAIGNPGRRLLRAEGRARVGGWGEAVTDDEIVDGIKLLARTEGIFTEPAGGTTVAVTKKLIEQGRIPRDESIVISVTGNGYKTLEAVLDTVDQPDRIPARLADFDALYARLTGTRQATTA